MANKIFQIYFPFNGHSDVTDFYFHRCNDKRLSAKDIQVVALIDAEYGQFLCVSNHFLFPRAGKQIAERDVFRHHHHGKGGVQFGGVFDGKIVDVAFDLDVLLIV